MPVNDAPVAAGDAATVAEDGATALDVLANDSDVDGDTLTVTSVGAPAHGTAVLQGDGTVLYTPQANYNGGDSFTYSIADGNGGTDSASAAIAVTPVNDAPVAADSSAQVAQNTPEDIPLDAADLDGDTLTYAVVTQPAHGTLSGSGSSRTYTPDHNYQGTDSFTFLANDGTVELECGHGQHHGHGPRPGNGQRRRRLDPGRATRASRTPCSPRRSRSRRRAWS